MKKLALIILCIVIAAAFGGCEKVNNNAYEMMTDAAINGNYADALEYYNKGGAASGKTDTTDWYFYSMAMNDYAVNGCLGYPYSLLNNKCSDSFSYADKRAAEIKTHTDKFEGTYKCGMMYLYIQNGIVAVNNGAHLTGTVYCTDELAVKDGKYYWATHSADGEDIFRYELILTDNGITVTPVTDTDNMFAGEYVTDYFETPVLTY